MSIILDILGIVFTAALAENALFVRCFTTDVSDIPRSSEELRIKNAVIIVMTTLAALAGWLGRIIFAGMTEVPVYFSTPMSIIVYIAIFFLLYAIVRYVPWSHAVPAPELEQSVKSCFAFLQIGVLLLTNLGSYNWYESLIFGFASAMGYLLAMQIYLILEDRLKYTRIPFFLRGLPMRLISMGLFSLALYGLLGHSLAA